MEALQSGAIYGCASLVDGVVRRIAVVVGLPTGGLTVIATGVLAPLVVEESEAVTRHEPHLTLHGLRIAFERNR